MFKSGHAYELINFQGFIDANMGNFNLAHEIKSTGGIIIPKRISNNAVMGVTYADNSVNEWACILAHEVRFFKEVPPANSMAVAKNKPKGPVLMSEIKMPIDNYPTEDIKFPPNKIYTGTSDGTRVRAINLMAA